MDGSSSVKTSRERHSAERRSAEDRRRFERTAEPYRGADRRRARRDRRTAEERRTHLPVAVGAPTAGGLPRWRQGLEPRTARVLLALALVVPAAALGALAGLGLDAMTGDDASAPLGSAAGSELSLSVASAELHRATTPAGQERNRARLTVDATLRNTGDEAALGAAGTTAALSVAGRRIPADATALRGPSGLRLDIPLAGGTERQGQVRFELAGEATRTLARRGGRLVVTAPGGDRKTARIAPDDL